MRATIAPPLIDWTSITRGPNSDFARFATPVADTTQIAIRRATLGDMFGPRHTKLETLTGYQRALLDDAAQQAVNQQAQRAINDGEVTVHIVPENFRAL